MNELERTKTNKDEKLEGESRFFDFLNQGEKDQEEKLNRLLKALRTENREACFSLLNCFSLNRNFEFQNLKDSLKDEENINEYINVKLLEKEIYPKDGDYEDEKKRREQMLNMVLNMKRNLENVNGTYETSSTLWDLSNEKREKTWNNEKEKYEKKNKIDNDALSKNVPHFWKTDNVVGTFNPVYNARTKLMNDEVMNTIPTVDIFYNSSKLLSIQTIFEPVSRYIFLLRLLPHFCLPLYDSGILQFVCEDVYLNPKFKGLEISYRLLIHDILFYAFFSYLSDLPFWAKPPIQLLRIYNYESLYSFNDWESVHTERLVFHNIKNVLFNFSDTLSKIELLYPKDYYITVFPNIYFKNIIEFLKSENFKLKKIVIVIKGKKYIDAEMMKTIKENLQNFKGITTENENRKENKKVSFKKDEPVVETRNTAQIIEAMKKCISLDKIDIVEKESDKVLNMNPDIDRAIEVKKKKNENVSKNNSQNLSQSERCFQINENFKNYSSFSKMKGSEENLQKREGAYVSKTQNREMHVLKEKNVRNADETSDKEKVEGKCNRIDADTNTEGNVGNVDTNNKTWKQKSIMLDTVDMTDKYNMDNALYKMYYKKESKDSTEEDFFFNIEKTEKRTTEKLDSINEKREDEKKRQSDNNSSNSTCSDDESDDENVDGFFKSKKLKTTVYDKKTFSLTQMMSNVIHFDKIIDYLYNDDQHLYDANSKVKFYVKMLLFEKTYTNIDDPLTSTAANDTIEASFTENATHPREGEENMTRGVVVSNENRESNENNISAENDSRERTENNIDSNAADGRNIIFHRVIPDETSTSISNLIRNFQLSLEQSNFLSFTGVNITEETQEESNTEPNSFSFDNIQDSLTRITFNFN